MIRGDTALTCTPAPVVQSSPLHGRSEILRANAIKFAPNGAVELRCQTCDSGGLRIEVAESGVGIAADQVPFIFDEFYQTGVSPNSSREGYGLGLSIVQRIARLLDFRIEVSSTLGSGLSFAFELPRARDARPRSPGRERPVT
jgi:signal transduction histidine kinase